MAFRKIDIDSLEEQAFLSSDYLPASLQPTESPEEAASTAETRYTEVRNLLQRGDAAGAVKRSLESPAYGPDREAAKATSLRAVLEALVAVRAGDIPALITSLSDGDKDVLMKYLYRGWSSPKGVNCGSLLTWHEKLVEVTGQGAIVRVLTDRRTV